MNTVYLIDAQNLVYWLEIAGSIMIIIGTIVVFLLARTLYLIKTRKANEDTLVDKERAYITFAWHSNNEYAKEHSIVHHIVFDSNSYNFYSNVFSAQIPEQGSRKHIPQSGDKYIIPSKSKEIVAAYDPYALCDN